MHVNPLPLRFVPVAGGKVRLDDNININCNFDPAGSWKLDEVVTWPAPLPQFLLDHEQGHYDICALICRDLFIRLMQAKPRQFDSGPAGWADLEFWVRTYREREQRIQRAYDSETNHSAAGTYRSDSGVVTPPSRKGPPQARWEALIAQAFNTPRPNGGASPDGIPYKMELTDVLVQAGISI